MTHGGLLPPGLVSIVVRLKDDLLACRTQEMEMGVTKLVPLASSAHSDLSWEMREGRKSTVTLRFLAAGLD